MRSGESDIFIQSIFMLPDGDIVGATTTEEAEIGLNALIEYLNVQFRYRMVGPSAKRHYPEHYRGRF